MRERKLAFFYTNKLQTIPTKLPIIYSESKIKMLVSICLRFLLNNTTIPMPLPAHNPAIIAPKVIPPAIKSSTKNTDDAQDGISPTSAAKNG